MANIVGAELHIEGEENGIVLPKPAESFVDLGAENAIKTVRDENAALLSLEKLIDVVENTDLYEFWLTSHTI